MEEQHKQCITANLTRLVEATDFNLDLEMGLLARGVFNEEMLKEIKANERRCTTNLYLKVQTRGPQAFSNLQSALVASRNLKAARILESAANGEGEEEPVPVVPTDGQRGSKVWNQPTYPPELPAAPAPPYIPPPVLADSTTPLTVKVKNATVRKGSNPDTCYRMAAKPRGQVLIIDNEEFLVHNKRTGSLVDANNLDLLFEQLGFKVVLRRNLNYSDMMGEIMKFSRKPEHMEADMAVVVVLSHGSHGLLAASDGKEIETEWLLRQFNNEGCPALKGKPKFFILQACRGDDPDFGVLPKIEFPDSATDHDASRVEDFSQGPKEDDAYKSLSWEDMLIAYATLPGYVANRDRYRGTWFIESLIQVFMDMAWDMDIKDMLDLVGQRLKTYESERGTKQSFEYVVRHFYKKLYFNPGL